MNTEMVVTFQYDNTDQESRIEQDFEEAQNLMRQGLLSVIQAGGKFCAIRDELVHNRKGGFAGWMESKGLKRSTVYRIIQLHDTFATVPFVGQLDIETTAGYLLSSPSVPDEARREALDRAAAGERIGVQAAREIITDHTPSPALPLSQSLRSFLAQRTADPVVWRAQLTQLVSRSPVAVYIYTKIQNDLALSGIRVSFSDIIHAAEELLQELPDGNREHTHPGSIAVEPESNSPNPPRVLSDLIPAIHSWLDQLVEDGELADDRDGRRYMLIHVLRRTNGLSTRLARYLAEQGVPQDAIANSEPAIRAVLAEFGGPGRDSTEPAVSVTSYRDHSGGGNGHGATRPATVHPIAARDAAAVAARRGRIITGLLATVETSIDWLISYAAGLEEPDERLATIIEALQNASDLAKESDV